MKRILNMCKRIWLAHASAIVVIMTFYMMLSSLIKNNVLLTTIATFVFVTLMYNAGWICGNKDARNIGGITPSLKTAVCAILFTSIIPVILLIIRVIAYHTYPTVWQPYGENLEMIKTTSPFLRISDVLYKVYNCYFLPILSGGELPLYILPIFVPIIIFPIGYILGTKSFSVKENYVPSIVYKKIESEDKQK